MKACSMDPLLVLLVLTHIVSTTPALHEGTLFYGCFESGEGQAQVDWDGETLLYADFEKGHEVWTLAEMKDIWPWPEFYTLGRISKERVCNTYLARAVKSDRTPSEAKAPTAVIYPREEAELGVENTLLCYVSHFYPPSINITWTRNGVKMTEGVALSSLHPETDGTFSQLASLPFSPETGGVLSCMVEHQTLSSPATRTWEFEASVGRSGPAVLFGAGLALGLLFLATGAILFIRALQLK